MENITTFIGAHAQSALYSLPVGIIILVAGILISKKHRLFGLPFNGIGIAWILWAFVGFYQI